MIALDLPNVWALILAVAVFAYVVMDGFDLGIGILFPLIKPGFQRDAASGVRRLKKIDLWEISLVTFPMLPQARVTALKQTVPTPVHQLRQRWLAAAQACQRSLRPTAPDPMTRR